MSLEREGEVLVLVETRTRLVWLHSTTSRTED